jgi:hypothetical protein
MEDEEEDVSSYWMTLRKGEDIGKCTWHCLENLLWKKE